jgi:hypothetical protein
LRWPASWSATDSSKVALAEAVDLGKDPGETVLAVFGYGVNPMGGEVTDHPRHTAETPVLVVRG